jgi:hypothetical protein
MNRKQKILVVVAIVVVTVIVLVALFAWVTSLYFTS